MYLFVVNLFAVFMLNIFQGSLQGKERRFFVAQYRIEFIGIMYQTVFYGYFLQYQGRN
jgi:hypothetical protein